MVSAAIESGAPLDISTQIGLWGGKMRGTEATIAVRGTYHHENAVSDKHASDLTQAHLIESLSSLGREYLDFYFLPVRRALEEYQIAGVLQAIELARAEGHIRFCGLWAEGQSLAALGLWQFNDAFEVVCAPYAVETKGIDPSLAGMAASRRVGVIARSTSVQVCDETQLVSVRSVDEIMTATKSILNA